MEDLFENEDRLPGQSWQPAAVQWTDIVSISVYIYKIRICY